MSSGSQAGLSREGRHELAALFGLGERTVTVERARERLGIGADQAAQRLAGWATRGWLRRVRRGLYLAVPVDAVDPANWTDDAWYLADLVWAPCYITGWSAANHWSLTDQVFRSTVVATSQRVRTGQAELAGNPIVLHHVDDRLLTWGMRSEWRHERRIRIADPARTVAEMLGLPALGGGIRHVADIVASYLAALDLPTAVGQGRGDEATVDLVAALDRLGNGAGFKRLGYLVEHLGLELPVLRDQCRERVTSGISKLDPALPAIGPRASAWGLRVNVAIES